MASKDLAEPLSYESIICPGMLSLNITLERIVSYSQRIEETCLFVVDDKTNNLILNQKI